MILSHSFRLPVTHFHALLHTFSLNFNAILCNFGYFSHFWANFNMLGIKMHVLELRNSLVILSKNFMCVFTQFHAIFTQFRLFQPFLGQFQYVGYQNACTWAEKFNGDTFIHFHTLLHALLHTVSRNFSYFSHFGGNFNMLGIKKHVLELKNSFISLAEALGLQKGPKAPK